LKKDLLQAEIKGKFKIGIRIAAEEEPKFEFRLGTKIGYVMRVVVLKFWGPGGVVSQ
jgi:hypothetical protein